MIERSEERDQAIKAALPHVPALGWTRAALSAGLADLGRDPLEQDWLFPRGPVEAIEAWCDLADREMEAQAVAEDLASLKIPRRIRRVVLIRLEQAAPDREAVRRALALQSLPWNLASAARTVARTADAMWAAAGDTSADFSWYTRRATLAAVYGATLAFWLQDDSEDYAATRGFLDRRLAGLARFQRMKRKA
ncbi:COQ9 family protein [Falsiroseomonas sp.]|uniref:COQ9 family protein n=1 Tax=Falsiroseomonas sp. TaxID=2870721 RepID=UPI002715E1DD|nr:COQ9 family protein [Falsiroseomonas sp.]MDO9503123.1 COQ9 family protein [Falsiroseomonas sp.]MDP3418234.1 COQ9 family protein [Falsiroseomonas sp.]